jgi:magnesium chelatase family protein
MRPFDNKIVHMDTNYSGVPAVLAKVLSSAVIGIDAFIVEVEVDIVPGLPNFTTVGLPEAAVKESKERVKAAVKNSGYTFPDDRITVNLAPAHIKKAGTGFDLPIALGIMCAIGTIAHQTLADFMFLGELSLDGRIKSVFGSLSMAIAAKDAGYKAIVVPYHNRKEASVIRDIRVYAAHNLAQVVEFLRGEQTIPVEIPNTDALLQDPSDPIEDFNEVKGQEHVKRAMEIAAAGGHNLLMIGPPGAGKTMLARRISSILPPMTFEEAIETTKIYSVMGMLRGEQALITRRQFRAPHHTISDAGLIGGGAIPRPGEVSLAHNGVLFLDELPEYKKHVLEVLRQPMEDHFVTISRAATSVTFPATFMLVAAMNPCPCGYATDANHSCHCTQPQIQRYRSKISGPLMDRIDMHVEVPSVSYRDLATLPPSEDSLAIHKRVTCARQVQSRRFMRERIYCNSQMGNRHIRTHCRLDPHTSAMLETAVDRLGLSARAFFRILKLARTIADLDQKQNISAVHLAEAIQYRTLDRSTAD